MVLQINKYSVPFGVLANDSNVGFTFNGEFYDNVNNFVSTINGSRYILDPPEDKSLRLAWDKEISILTQRGIEEGIRVKSVLDPEFDNELLKTNGLPLLYTTENQITGISPTTKTGYNLYGKCLEKYRDEIAANNPKYFYNSYLLQHYLTAAIFNEPIEPFLGMVYEGADIHYLLRILSERYGTRTDVLSVEAVENIRLNQQSSSPPLKLEDNIRQVMAKNMRQVRIVNLKKFSYRVLLASMRSNLESKGVQADDISFQVRKLVEENENILVEIMKQYDQGKLPEAAQQIRPEFYIPSIEQVNQAEKWVINPIKTVPIQDNGVFKIQDNDKLGMKNGKVMLTIQGKQFPTIQHYMVYVVGKLNPEMDSYLMIFNPKDNKFYHPDDATRFLSDNLDVYIENTNAKNLKTALSLKFNENKFLKDIIVSIGDVEQIDIRGLMSKDTNDFYMQMRNSLNISNFLVERGSVINFLEKDDFFKHCIFDMFFSFMSIQKYCTDKKSIDSVIKVYNSFFGSINGIEDGSVKTNIKMKLPGVNKQVSDYLLGKFVFRILKAETMARHIFKSDYIFLTKFIIIDSRRKIFEGAFNEPISRNDPFGKTRLAMAKVCRNIVNCNDNGYISKDVVLSAFEILSVPLKIPRKFLNVAQKEYISGLNIEPETYEYNEEIKNQEVYDIETLEEREEGDQADEEDLFGDDDYEYEDEDQNQILYENDIMYGVNDVSDSDMASDIMLEMKTEFNDDEAVRKYFNRKVEQLHNMYEKNSYRINLFSK